MEAFDNLKASLTSSIVLIHPDFDQPFILATAMTSTYSTDKEGNMVTWMHPAE